jgi:hypothetical protein
MAPRRQRGDPFARVVGAELSRFAARARRPWLDPDAARADAVLFEDEAELIACLIRDWLRGVVPERWWWVDLLRTTGVEMALRRHVLSRGEILVPALSLLAPAGEIVPFVLRLPDHDARAAAASVIRAYALVEVAHASENGTAAVDRRDDPAWRVDGDTVVGPRATSILARLMTAVPELPVAPCAREQRRLLALVFGTMRRLAWVRSPDFARGLVLLERFEPATITESRLADDVAAIQWPLPPPMSELPLRPMVTTDSRPGATTLRPLRTGAGDAGDSRSTTRDPHSARTSRARGRRPSMAESIPPAVGSTGPKEGQSRPPREVSRPRTEHEASADAAGDAPRRGAPWPPASTGFPSEGPLSLGKELIATDFGGILYLLNAWLAMELYGDFMKPRAENFMLSPWDLLALVGRTWFGAPFVGDPIWTALARLAGRDPEDEPGVKCAVPDDWLPRHLDTLIARLQRGLGIDECARIPDWLCRHQAAIDVTASAVHVHLSLCVLPLEIRVAGLDRDPGWIPAAGVSVYFHFA